MPRIFVTILAVLLVVAGVATASDLHIEASSVKHLSVDQPADNDKLPDSNGHCGCCCHGSAHYLALPLAEPWVTRLPRGALSLPKDNLLTSLPLAPPTHPPQT